MPFKSHTPKKIVALITGASEHNSLPWPTPNRSVVTAATHEHEHLADLIDSQTAQGFALAVAGRISGPINWRAAVRREVAVSNIFETA